MLHPTAFATGHSDRREFLGIAGVCLTAQLGLGLAAGSALP